jgi:hypothetical protein
MMSLLKSKNVARIVVGGFVLAIAWIGFQLGTHGHTGILRALANGRRFLRNAQSSFDAKQIKGNASSGRQHSVTLSWKASTSAVAGYNVYRRGSSGLIKINSLPVTGASYVDSTVQAGQTYYYMTRAVSSKGTESTPSNEVRVDVPSP